MKVKNAHAATGVIQLDSWQFPCALGRNGLTSLKIEGDGATPIGRWPIRQAYYRPDRIQRPVTELRLQPIRQTDGWCDAPHDSNYNRPISHPYHASAEHLWRDDHLYDLIVVVGYNDVQRSRHRGSAIFVHVAAPGFAPTEGCIALRRGDLIRLIGVMTPGQHLHIGPYHWR